MNYTPNYALNQWEKTDRIQMEDFNADNAKIEAALEAVNATAAAGLKMATGSYTGNGNYGSSHPNTLTFSSTPKVLFLFNCDANSGMNAPMMLVAPYTSQRFAAGTAGGYSIHVTWNSTSVSWYCENNAKAQFNQTYGTNYYIALG